MKIVTFTLLAVLSGIGISISAIWAVVGFILYLVKDREFNWWSVYCIPICLVLCILFAVLSAVAEHKTPKIASHLRKSKFQQKLDEMAEKRKQSNPTN